MSDLAPSPAQSRAPVCSARAAGPEVGPAGPALAPSNADRQSMLGLGQPDEEFSAAVAALQPQPGGFGPVLRALGRMAPVLLDALPTEPAYDAALDAWDVPASRDWVAEQPATDLNHLASTQALRLLDVLWPDGSFVQAFLQGFDLTLFGGEGSADLSAGLTRDKSRLAVVLSAAAGAGVGVGLGGTADASGDRGGFLVQAGWQQGMGFEAEWAIDVRRMLSMADASLGGVFGGVSIPDVLTAALQTLGEQLLAQVPRRLEVSESMSASATAFVGVEAGDNADPAVAALGEAKESLSGALGASVKAGHGYDGLRGHFFVEGVARAEASAATRGEEDSVGGEVFVRVEGWLAVDGRAPELEVTYGTRAGPEGARETRCYHSLAEVLAALELMLDEGDEPAAGDLVVARTHRLDGPGAEALAETTPLAPIFAGFDATAFGRTATFDVEVEAVVSGSETNPAVQTRDEQREVAATLFGERDDGVLDRDAWLLRKAELTHRVTDATVNLTVAAGEFGVSTGSHGYAAGRKVDVAAELDADGVAALLHG